MSAPKVNEYGNVITSKNRTITRFGKKHADFAVANPLMRDSPHWDTYWNDDLKRFIKKTGKVTINKKRVNANGEYAKVFDTGKLVVALV